MLALLRHSFAVSVFLLAVFVMAGPAAALTIKDVRIGMHPGKTRMVMDLSEVSKFRIFVLDNPWRLVIDMPVFDWQAGAIAKPTKSEVITIRQGPLQPGISRIVIDLKQPVAIDDAFLLRAHEGKPDRLVVDFNKTTPAAYEQTKGKTFGILEVNDTPPPVAARSAPQYNADDDRRTASRPVTMTAGEPVAAAPEASPGANVASNAVIPPPKPSMPPAAVSAPVAPVPAPPPAAASSQAQSYEQQYAVASGMAVPERKPYVPAAAVQPSRATPQAAPPPSRSGSGAKKVIVIDPGHGGVDPGAIGANGVFEKHIALSMSKELKKILEATGRYDVKLTRTRDSYKRLYQRVDFARVHNADLFISIHADTIGKSSVRGASVYTLSEKASDAQTARLADRENKADIIAGTDLSHEDEQVANILIDMAVTDTKNQSNFFANTIVSSMESGGIKVLQDPHRSAGFAVLKAPDVPSILIELGFMSNKAEAEMLSKPDYRRKLALSIVSGVENYFEQVRRNNRM